MALKGQIVFMKFEKFWTKNANVKIAGIAAIVRLIIIERIMYTEYAAERSLIFNPSQVYST
jgi:hypothetical protein